MPVKNTTKAVTKSAKVNKKVISADVLVKYIGNKKDFKLARKEFSREYDFSKGEAKVIESDAKSMLKLFPTSFAV